MTSQHRPSAHVSIDFLRAPLLVTRSDRQPSRIGPFLTGFVAAFLIIILVGIF